MNRSRYFVCLVLITSLLSACGTVSRTPFHVPSVDIPKHWNTELTGEYFAKTNNFWEAFQDPQLNQLIAQVLSTNNDLAMASLTLKQAQFGANMATLDTFLPNFSISGEVSAATQNLRKISGRIHIPLSYEIDLFGRLSAERDEKTWHMRATETDRRSIALSLVGKTADLYWKTAYLKQSLDVIKQCISNTQTLIQLSQAQFEAGAISLLQWKTAQQQLPAILATYHQHQQLLTETRHALAILLNQAPEQTIPERNDLVHFTLPAIRADLPAKVLINRPDIQAAEYRVHQALAAVDASHIMFNPILQWPLSLLDAMANPSHILTVALAPINWKDKKWAVKTAKIEYEKSVIAYRDTVHKALGEVENTLFLCQLDKERAKQLAQSFNLALEQEHLTQARYLAGNTSKAEWLRQQTERHQIELEVLEHQYLQLTHTMTLYRALGGGNLPFTK